MKPMHQAICLSALLLACLPSAHAGIHSIRAGVAMLPTSFDVEYEDRYGYTYEFSGSDDSATRRTITYQYLANNTRTAAFVINAGLDFSNFDYGNGEVDQVGLRVEPGVAFNINQNFRIETVGSIGLGTSNDSNGSEDGGWADFGVLVRPAYAFDCGITLTGQLGILAHATVYEQEDNTTVTISRSGFTAGLGLGFQFR